jgi:hypothetical protein
MSVEPFLGEYQVFNFRRHLILSCQGHLNIFPFDDPECSFSLESSKSKDEQFVRLLVQ